MEDDILINNYLQGLLSENEQNSFLERLEFDSNFRDTFKLEEQLFNSLNEDSWSFIEQKNSEVDEYLNLLEEDDLKKLKKTLNRVSEEFKETPKKKTKYRFYYLAAASIALLISLSIFLNQDASNQELVNDYLDTSRLPSFVSRGEASIDDLIEAQHYFENEDYQRSLDIFTTALETNTTNASIYLYTGISQMRLEKYTAAELTFDKLIQSDLLDAQKGHWYKALLYLKQDKVVESKIMLEKIVANSYYNHSKAKELLEKLNDD
nr:hypothetical protein [uncultured Psychroserpens sp.]